MRVENRSAFHPSKRILPLVEFVTARTRYSALATLRLTDSNQPGSVSGGYAWKHRPDVCDLSSVAPSLVCLQLSHKVRYPAASLYVEEVGAVQLRSFEEEFVFVLAHEARHVDQFWSTSSLFDDEHDAEVDAEKFARRVLQHYRKARGARVSLSDRGKELSW